VRWQLEVVEICINVRDVYYFCLSTAVMLDFDTKRKRGDLNYLLTEIIVNRKGILYSLKLNRNNAIFTCSRV
jgi:hypothetical protein